MKKKPRWSSAWAPQAPKFNPIRLDLFKVLDLPLARISNLKERKDPDKDEAVFSVFGALIGSLYFTNDDNEKEYLQPDAQDSPMDGFYDDWEPAFRRHRAKNGKLYWRFNAPMRRIRDYPADIVVDKKAPPEADRKSAAMAVGLMKRLRFNPMHDLRWSVGPRQVASIERLELGAIDNQELSDVRLEAIKLILDSKYATLETAEEHAKALELGLVKVKVDDE